MEWEYIFSVIVPLLFAKRAKLCRLIKLLIMALIRFSNLVNDIRGSSGGNVFARNRSGAYVRNRTTPLNPQSSPQMSTRASFGALAQEWRNLTQTQRDGWNEAVENFPYQNKLGETRLYSGEQLFIKLNRNLQSAELPTISDAPSPGDVSAVSSITATADVMGPSFQISGTTVNTVPTDVIVIQATAPKSAGIATQDRSQFRNIAVLDTTAFEAGADQIAAYEEIYGSIASSEGSKIFIRAYGVSTVSGQASAPFQVGTIVVDTTP